MTFCSNPGPFSSGKGKGIAQFVVAHACASFWDIRHKCRSSLRLDSRLDSRDSFVCQSGRTRSTLLGVQCCSGAAVWPFSRSDCRCLPSVGFGSFRSFVRRVALRCVASLSRRLGPSIGGASICCCSAAALAGFLC